MRERVEIQSVFQPCATRLPQQQHWHEFPVTPEYSELLSYVTFLLLYFQLRVNWCSFASVVIFSNSGEINSLSQFSAVFSHQCVVQCTLHEFAFSRSCRVGCSSGTLTHCVHIPQALSLDQVKMSHFVEQKQKNPRTTPCAFPSFVLFLLFFVMYPLIPHWRLCNNSFQEASRGFDNCVPHCKLGLDTDTNFSRMSVSMHTCPELPMYSMTSTWYCLTVSSLSGFPWARGRRICQPPWQVHRPCRD